ncbi:GlcNAc-transferase family protein [Azospirillum thermophilum]|uniref:Glycosyltransferase (GlcNAc) n=1 Tax=Azospirillum thermophilum TaxID=2202148 RepID=A0A2S2CZL8_9PROT|nr:GlcNAc-transferase family protein [Azospirillum thermophilum]AWK89888.1 hypothetical protein DEW08_28115 [Azospirillum thermophilum]
MTIFISIAAYRDSELAPTIRDCLAQARDPLALRFGICWQHGDDEQPLPEFSDPRFRVIAVPWRESAGACWARAEIMRLWNGEDFFLQIDSHHRFAPHWDAVLLAQAALCGTSKPVLSTYVAAYDPIAGARQPAEPMQMEFDRFDEDGIPLFRSHAIAPAERARGPRRARFLSGHFLFAPGSFVRDVPYDPSLYFIGEEITLAIRAFTHGYELFHPSEHVLWHEYSRLYRTKHWDDHVAERGVPEPWHLRDRSSRTRVSRFLSQPDVGPFGCGTVRSFAGYEAYAGLDFRQRVAHPAALRGEEPPRCHPASESTAARRWDLRIVLKRADLPAAALADPQFWYVGFHDDHGAEIHRSDADGPELRALVAGDSPEIVISRGFLSARPPTRWTVWPVSHSQGWLDKLVGAL